MIQSQRLRTLNSSGKFYRGEDRKFFSHRLSRIPREGKLNSVEGIGDETAKVKQEVSNKRTPYTEMET